MCKKDVFFVRLFDLLLYGCFSGKNAGISIMQIRTEFPSYNVRIHKSIQKGGIVLTILWIEVGLLSCYLTLSNSINSLIYTLDDNSKSSAKFRTLRIILKGLNGAISKIRLSGSTSVLLILTVFSDNNHNAILGNIKGTS